MYSLVSCWPLFSEMHKWIFLLTYLRTHFGQGPGTSGRFSIGAAGSNGSGAVGAGAIGGASAARGVKGSSGLWFLAGSFGPPVVWRLDHRESSWIIVENKLESSWHLVWKSSEYHWMCIYLVKKIRWRFKKQSRNTESNWCNKWVSDSPLWGSLKMNGNLSRALYTYIIINTLFGACQLTDFVNISYQLQEHEIQIAGLKLK